ncbi:hypothetical protein ACQY1Q_15565 [Tenacibaculum sp. TC6]|uniref:hypothetical protein n=1 Tax=Tenacibaculum sp. TC6 TaxID=3423223 RepID=UPI003D36CEBF
MKVFKEEQRFTQTWLITLMAISLIVPLILIGKEFATGKIQIPQFIGIICLLVFASGFIFFFKLITRIDEIGIHYQFIPFHLRLKTIKWSEISKAYIRKYDALSEYGGWGLKSKTLWSKQQGKAINVSGDIGIQLELKNGKKLLIGTRQESNAKLVLDTYQHKITQL